MKPTKFGFFFGGGGGRKNHTLGFKWSFTYTLVQEMGPEAGSANVRLQLGGGGGSSEVNFVRFEGF